MPLAPSLFLLESKNTAIIRGRERGATAVAQRDAHGGVNNFLGGTAHYRACTSGRLVNQPANEYLWWLLMGLCC